MAHGCTCQFEWHTVALAKQHIRDLFAGEGIRDLGLEEVEYDNDERMWRVTIVFSRPWDEPKGPLGQFAGVKKAREYKDVRIADLTDGTQEVRSLRRFEARI